MDIVHLMKNTHIHHATNSNKVIIDSISTFHVWKKDGRVSNCKCVPEKSFFTNNPKELVVCSNITILNTGESVGETESMVEIYHL